MKNASAPQKNRVTLVYGANGSGKSTIARGFREYAESTIPRTVELSPRTKHAMIKMSPGMKAEKFLVFDEEYISKNIKVQEAGLGTIVLFGKQVELEKKLEQVKMQISQNQTDIDSIQGIISQFNSRNTVKAPEYWQGLITRKLQDSGGWAETKGIRIKRNQIKTRVTDTEIDRLGGITPRWDESTTKIKFDELFNVFDKIDSSVPLITQQVQTIAVPHKIVEETQALFLEMPENPKLSPREEELLNTLGIQVLSDAKGFLMARSNGLCPTCLQPISEEHRTATLQQIDKILNGDMEEYRNKLTMLMLPEIKADDYRQFNALDAELLGKALLQIVTVNTLIGDHNNAIQAKIADPLSVAVYPSPQNLIVAYEKLNDILKKLENKRTSFNEVVINRQATEKELLKLNDEIASYAIRSEFQSLLLQRSEKNNLENKLDQLIQTKERLIREQLLINAERQNFQIALEQINRSLSYIFYSDRRLKLHLDDDQMYHLRVNGKAVSPDKISCGERNALALSYFFAEIAKETDFQKMYQDEMFLVIDDPVSSFDTENRVGILSFLRYKLHQVLSSCSTTKVLVMTHDISVMFDLQKAMEEISVSCASIGKHAEYCAFQLQNKGLINFKAKSHNEYTRLMRCVFEYGCNPEDSQELTIGNSTRRVLEAFATFLFKEGPDKVSWNPKVLSLIPDQNKREYFQNSMYRLVLNTESHFQESTQGSPEMTFFSHLTASEKQRTARDVYLFIPSLTR